VRLPSNRSLIGAGLAFVVATVIGLFIVATPPEGGGREGHGGFIAPIESGR